MTLPARYAHATFTRYDAQTPSLWWTLLAIPAKTGVPYEIGLKGVQLLTAALMIWLERGSRR